jgi:hypothetical protein
MAAGKANNPFMRLSVGVTMGVVLGWTSTLSDGGLHGLDAHCSGIPVCGCGSWIHAMLAPGQFIHAHIHEGRSARRRRMNARRYAQPVANAKLVVILIAIDSAARGDMTTGQFMYACCLLRVTVFIGRECQCPVHIQT